MLSTLNEDHVLRAFASTDDYLYRVSEGSCLNSANEAFQGVLLTGVSMPTETNDWETTDFVLSCSLCIDLSHSSITSLLGPSKSYTTFSVVAQNYSGENQVGIFFQETSAYKHVVIFFLDKHDNS